MSFTEEKAQNSITEKKEKLERLSDLTQTLDDMTLEKHLGGVYNISLSAEDYYLICEAAKEYLLSTAREIQPREVGKDDTARKDASLTADDFTDFHEIYREYSGSTRSTTYIFTCKVCGEPDILTFELSSHDEYTEGFTIHTEKNDIWDDWDTRMGWDELQRLESKVKSEASFGFYTNGIRRAKTLEDLTCLQHSLWDLYDPDLSPDQRNLIEEMIDQKTADLRKECIAKEDWIFDLTDTTERYAIYLIDDERNASEPAYKNKDYSYVKNNGLKVKAEDYYMAYGGVLGSEKTLDSIFSMFHLGRESNQMSISDVILLNRGGEVKAYYMDSYGFHELPDFVQERQKMAYECNSSEKRNMELWEGRKQTLGRRMQMKR